jgi:signal transduction histidine kinase
LIDQSLHARTSDNYLFLPLATICALTLYCGTGPGLVALIFTLIDFKYLNGVNIGHLNYVIKVLTFSIVAITLWILTSLTQKNRLKSDSIAKKLRRERMLREKMVSAITHDLRGPLTSAKAILDLSLRFPERDSRASAAHALKSLARMDQMLQDLLDISVIQAGKTLQVRIMPVDCKTLIEEVYYEMCQTYGPRFYLDVERCVEGYWSPELLIRMLENLLTNAIKYGSRDTIITISAYQTDHSVMFSVHNFGNEISFERQALLFKPFERGPCSSEKGWGLGLTLVAGIAEAHGGTVEIESGKGSGTTVRVRLPIDSRPYQK